MSKLKTCKLFASVFVAGVKELSLIPYPSEVYDVRTIFGD